jgi:IS30 family transposase
MGGIASSASRLSVYTVGTDTSGTCQQQGDYKPQSFPASFRRQAFSPGAEFFTKANPEDPRDQSRSANRAQIRADERKKESHQRNRLPNPMVRLYVEYHLVNDGWTPEEIAGRLPVDVSGLKTNYESIYLWIYHERRDLIRYLVRGHKQRHKRAKEKKSRTGKIPGRVDLSERPGHVDIRNRGGHWEVDTVVSRQSAACTAVLVERKSRFYLVLKMGDKTAKSMHRALVKALSRLPKKLRRTLTYDNGLENALHELTNRVLGTASYFCKPYHSWEKGSIENRNGILRRYFPKKHNWSLTSQKQIDRVIKKINSTPMKCLDYRTPAEVFSELGGVALAG